MPGLAAGVPAAEAAGDGAVLELGGLLYESELGNAVEVGLTYSGGLSGIVYDVVMRMG